MASVEDSFFGTHTYDDPSHATGHSSQGYHPNGGPRRQDVLRYHPIAQIESPQSPAALSCLAISNHRLVYMELLTRLSIASHQLIDFESCFDYRVPESEFVVLRTLRYGVDVSSIPLVEV
jgi:hypothetical protein